MVLIIVHSDQKSKIEFLEGVIEGGVRKITHQVRYWFEVSNFDWPLNYHIVVSILSYSLLSKADQSVKSVVGEMTLRSPEDKNKTR